jgi:hypothetical protein
MIQYVEYYWGVIWVQYIRNNDITLWYADGPQYLAHHHFRQKNNEWFIVSLKFRIRSSQIRPRVSRLKGFKLHYSKMGA